MYRTRLEDIPLTIGNIIHTAEEDIPERFVLSRGHIVMILVGI